jgi:hypothetical protein
MADQIAEGAFVLGRRCLQRRRGAGAVVLHNLSETDIVALEKNCFILFAAHDANKMGNKEHFVRLGQLFLKIHAKHASAKKCSSIDKIIDVKVRDCFACRDCFAH